MITESIKEDLMQEVTRSEYRIRLLQDENKDA